TMLFYYGPAVYALCAAYLAVRLVVDRWRLDAFDSMVAALVASGSMLFGVALGRSDNAHLIFALPPAFCLHLLFVGRSGSILRENITGCRVRKFRYAEFLICTAFLFASLAFFNPALLARKTAERAKDSVEKMLYALKLPKPLKVYGPAFMEVVEHVRTRTGPHDYVLALPSNSAYYYLTDRRNPTRFCQFAMLATDRHRVEVLEDIRRRRPKYVIYDIIGERVDEISDEVQFPGALDFILRNYAGEERIGDTLILLDGDFIPGRGPSETPLLEWGFSRPEIPARLDLKGARVLGRSSLGLHLSLEIPEAELSINGLALDSGNFYLLRLSARIDEGNVGKIAWTVNRGGEKKTYSKMLTVNMKGEWQEYRMLIATRKPSGMIESIKLIASDDPTGVCIRSITLTRLNHLTPRK
ncbi:MAG: hypothetical protein JSV16_00225, partial [Candidatus Hydrogenedentota bacterium]